MNNWSLPDAYVDLNVDLPDTIANWNRVANQTWYTERVVPWVRTDEIRIMWQPWKQRNKKGKLRQT